MKKEFSRKVPSDVKNDFNHLNRQIPPEAHTPMYNFHKYWSRKTWNVVGKFIETYCPECGIVFDPFGGSGVSAIEALKRKRRVIISDISPLATELTRLTIKPVSLTKLHEAYERVEKNARKKINDLYLTKCGKCGAEFPFDCAIWEQEVCKSIRYKSCPNCGNNERTDCKLSAFDKNILSGIQAHKIKEWHPDNRLYHITGKPFKEKQQYESLDQLFTKRNLYALAILMRAIEKEENKDLKSFLKIAFSSMVHLCSRMTPVRPTRPMSSAWTEHSYWYANEFMEQNVWLKFESSVIGKQGLIKAKEESNRYFQKVRFASSLKQFVKEDSDIFIYTGSCLDLIKDIKKYLGDKQIIDYIFTDPPYDSSIQYGELSFLWIAWLKMDKNYLENIALNEIVHNDRQNKDFEVYHSLLKNSFEGMFDVLRQDRYLTLTFHNPTFKVRNATIRAGVLTGFELEKIHHQELARPSAKSLLQPFGSAQGDFYLRFRKPDLGGIKISPEEIDELRFEKIVTDTAVSILAERGEPTPYTIIINAIDPELAKRGYFSKLHTGLDVKNVLEKHIDKEFTLIGAKIGGASGKLWWFKNPAMVPHLEKIPLSERVEKTVLLKLQQKGRATFTDIWDAVSMAFPNSLTSDQTSIKDALETYAHPISGGYWLLNPSFGKEESEREHSTIIALLSEMGIKNGYKIYVGKNEQNHKINTPLINKAGTLGQYMDYTKVITLKNIQNPDIVDDIDILWIKNDRIEFLFEVECTTSMTSALLRGSNVEKEVKKIMLLPADRENQFRQKLKSPMFYESFSKDNWSFIIFDELYSAWYQKKKELNIEELFDKPYSGTRKKYDDKSEGGQMSLFEWRAEYGVGEKNFE
jgi:DNA modification methylase